VSCRPGLTLLETVLLLLIVVLSVGLLLPAVLRVREAANRARCARNLGQASLGFLRFHDAHGALPQGGTSDEPGAFAPPDNRAAWSWSYHLLPHIGQAELHRADDDTIATTPVPLYYCPSRRYVSPYEGLSKICYAGNAGSTPDGSDGTLIQGDRPRLRLVDIEDGAANTLLAAERQLNRAELGRSADDDAPFHRPGWGDWEAYRWGRDAPARDVSVPGDLSPRRAFGSAHKAGLNAAFADGSVRHVSLDVSADVWLRICVRDDAANSRRHFP
jgi:prepilin-type processing-associated H-X9-DG protein